MRYPKGRRRPKNDGSKSHLVVQYGSPEGELPGLQYYWRLSDEDYKAGVSARGDTMILINAFEKNLTIFGNTVVEELTKRGYDISTLKFTIERLKK